MLNGKKILLVLVVLFISLFFIAFGYFFIISSVSVNSFDKSEPINVPDGRVLKLDQGWKVYRDSGFTEEVDLQPETFVSGEYYFRTVLDTKDMQGNNAFLLNPIYSAYILYVNGIRIDSTGVPSSTNETIGLNRTHSVYFFQDSDRLEIVLHVSNFHHSFGGSLLNWISYGRHYDIEEREHLGKLLDGLIVFCLSCFALMNLFNYYYTRRYEYSFYFFYYMLTFVLYVLFSGRILAGWMFPMISGALVYQFEEYLFLMTLPLVIQYLHALFPDEIHKAVIRIIQLLSLVLALLMFILPVKFLTQVSLGSSALVIAGIFYMIWRLIVAVRAGRKGAVLTFVSFGILFLCMLNDFLSILGVLRSVRLMYAGLFIFGLQQTYRLTVVAIRDNRSFEATHSRLAAVMNQKEHFFSNNSIELAKPIRNIVELGESLLKGSIGPLNSEQIATSSLIVSNGVRLSNMVNDILDFTKIKEQSIELKYGPVDFYKISRKVLNSCEALVAIQELELASEVDRELRLVSADEQRLEQILYNLISNSIRHTERGRVVIGATDKEEALEISILVEGSDLDEDNINAMFTAYEHGLSDDLDEQNVSDLSLAIAKNLITLHGSEILMETGETGFVYKFNLSFWKGESPFSEEEALEMDALINLQPILDEITSDRNIEILIAGKDVEELQILKSQLSSMNYSVVPMVTGAELLARVKESVPHLIVIDVKLPDMSGYDVCTELRSVFSKDELPIILVINKEDISDMMEGLTSGANDFLTRPYLQEEFLTRVNTHLQLSRISNIYSRFVPTEFLSSLGQENITDVELGDQVSREMTILFVDIRAFTNLSENMTPEENFKFINSYLSRFSPMITNNGGFVDKYIGDAIMALFPNKPEDALAAAKEMIEHVNVYNGHRANCGYKPINIGIGIHTGNMILGIIGDEKRMQGTVISDAVNLASRIQDVTKLYKANVVISQETFVKLENPVDYNFRFLGRVKVKGKDKAVALFEIFDADSEEKRKLKNDTKADFEDALMKFSRREFGEAQELFSRVAGADPDDMTTGIFLERIEEMRRAEKKAFLTSL